MLFVSPFGKRAGLIACAICFTTSLTWAQTQGEITGVVTDPTGGMVAGAKVTVTNPLTNFTRQVISNSSGNYTFPALLPGLYTVKAEMAGFQTEVRTGVE